MKKKLIPFIVIIALVFGAYSLVTTALNNFLSGPRLKAMLIEPVEKALGRDVEIGSVNVSIFEGISINKITVKDTKQEEVLASVESFKLSYDLLPLFRKKLVITSIELISPKINVTKNKKGEFNVATIGQATTKKEEEPNYDEEPVNPLPMELSFNNIAIKKAGLTLTDMTGELPNITAESNATLSLIIGKSLSETTINGSISIDATGDYKEKKPVLYLKGMFSQKSFSFQGNLSMEFDKFIFNGKIDNYATSPEVTFNVNSPKINLDNLMALVDAGKAPVKTSQGGQNTEDKTAPEKEAPLNKEAPDSPEPLPTETDLEATAPEEPTMEAAALQETPNELTPPEKETEEVAALPDKVMEPAPAQQSIKVSYMGEISISELVSKDFKANSIKAFYSLKDHTFKVKNAKVEIFGGEIGGNVSLDMNAEYPPIYGDINTSGIMVSELLDKMGKSSKSLSGALSSDITFNGTGLEWPVLQKTLNGNGNYSLVDGGINSPITSTFAVLLDLPELNDLQFKDLSGSFTIVNGDVLLNASLTGSQVDITGEGKVGLDSNLDLPITMNLSPEYSQKLADKASFSNYLADEQGRVSLRLNMTGTTSDPKIGIDQGQVVEKAKEVVVKKVEEEIGKAISKELGVSPDEGNVVKGLSEKFLNQMLTK